MLRVSPSTSAARLLHTSALPTLAPRRAVVAKGLVSPERPVPIHIPQPNYAILGYVPKVESPTVPHRKTQGEIEAMRESCALAREVLDLVGSHVEVGITTDELDAIAHDAAIARKAYPSPLRYKGFPKAICTSVNEVQCHGIPDDRALIDGDLINIDVTLFYHGFHGDVNATYPVGNVDQEGLDLLETSRLALDRAIAICKPGVELSAIGDAIGDVIEPRGYSVASNVGGHGIGRQFHEAPSIFHGRVPEGMVLPGIMLENTTFTIEPIVCEGSGDNDVWDDEWTMVSIDGKRNACFEETLLITATGVEVLTAAR